MSKNLNSIGSALDSIAGRLGSVLDPLAFAVDSMAQRRVWKRIFKWIVICMATAVLLYVAAAALPHGLGWDLPRVLLSLSACIALLSGIVITLCATWSALVRHINAEIHVREGAKIEIFNRDGFDWKKTIIRINRDYALTLGTIGESGKRTIGLSQFVKKDGTRFNSLTTKIMLITVWCRVPVSWSAPTWRGSYIWESQVRD